MIDDFRQDCEDWWQEFKEDSQLESWSDYPNYQPQDPDKFDLDIPY